MDIDLGKITVEDYKEERYKYVGYFHDGLALVQNKKTNLWGIYK